MPAMLYRCSVMLVLAAALGGLSRASAQEAKKPAPGVEENKPDPNEPVREIPFWDTDFSFQIRAAVAVIGAEEPWRALATRMAVSENVPVIRGWEFVFDKVFPLDRRALDLIQDERPLPDLRAKLFTDLKAPDRGFYLAYLQALRQSFHATEEQFENSAEEHKNVVYTHLITDAKRYRGKVITVKGKLVRVMERDAPDMVQGLDQDNKRKMVYSGYILSQTKGLPPFTIVFTELPKEISVSEKMDVPATFYGYFLANVRFLADKGRGVTQKDIISPYLVGKTVIVPTDKKPLTTPTENTAYSYELIAASVGAIVFVVFLGVALNVWFRRGDSKVQSQLADVRDRHVPFALESDSTPPEPPVPLAKPIQNLENGITPPDRPD